MSEDDAPVKKPRSEAQIQALNKAHAKAVELRTQRNDIRQKHGITDETDATPEETETETENSETETDSEESKAAVVEKEKPKPAVVETKPKTEPAPKPRQPKPQSKPQQIEEHVPIPQNFRMMNRNQYILFEE